MAELAVVLFELTHPLGGGFQATQQ